MVRAKFLCTSKREYIGSKPVDDGQGGTKWVSGALWAYEFGAVTGKDGESKVFWYASPSGKIELSSVHSELFQVGQEYYIDFHPVSTAEVAPTQGGQ